MEILVNVANQKLKIATNLKTLVEGTQEFIFFRFNLSNDWDGLQPFAQFTQNGNSYNQYLDDDNCVALPAEIVSGTCTMMLYGSKGTKRATTNYLTLILDKNILVQDAQSTEISQSLYDQLVSQIDAVPVLIEEAETAIENANRATTDANVAAVEANKATERANEVIAFAEGEHIIPDFEMSDTSENAVQNRAVKAYIDEKAKGYELFNDITLTEDVVQVERSLDDNGQPFKIKKLFLLFIGKCTPDVSFPVLFRFNNGTIYQSYKTMKFTGADYKFLWMKSEKIADGIYRSEYPSTFVGSSSQIKISEDGSVFNQGLAGSAGEVYSNVYFALPPKNEAQSTGTKWHFGTTSASGALLLAGSRIIVMGVRE